MLRIFSWACVRMSEVNTVCVCIYKVYTKHIRSWSLYNVNISEAYTLCACIYIYIYIYIYILSSTDCFILSELFSVARYVRCLKPELQPIQLCVRLSLRPLSQQAYHIWLREFLRYYVATASSSVRLVMHV